MYYDLQEDTHVYYNKFLALFESSTSSSFFGQCAVLFCCKAEELDVWKCWDSNFGFFLKFLSLSSIGAARLLGLFAANYSLGVFLSLCESSTSGSFLGKCAGLVCCKTGGGAGCFLFVGGARTIILSIKLRWRSGLTCIETTDLVETQRNDY